MAGTDEVDPVSVVPESVVPVIDALIGNRGEAVDQALWGADGNQVDVPVQGAVDMVDGATGLFSRFDVSDAEVERIATAQAKAVSALLSRQADCLEVG